MKVVTNVGLRKYVGASTGIINFTREQTGLLFKDKKFVCNYVAENILSTEFDSGHSYIALIYTCMSTNE